MSYCLNSFGHLIRLCHKENFSAGWEIDALVHGEEIGVKFQRLHIEKDKLERSFGASWTFHCPVCHDVDCVIAELDADRLAEREIFPKRMACTNCGFLVLQSHPLLSKVLLEWQLIKAKPNILAEYGIK
jgi:hypothetical protein